MMITSGPKKFHKMIQKHVRVLDYEIIADRYGISKRTVEAIIQGRRNNPVVLTELVKIAKSNVDMDAKQIDLYLENVTQINDAHFKIRDMYGVPEDKDNEEENK